MNFTMNHLFFAFGIPSGPDMFVIAILVLILFGAKKLPLFARSLGRSMGEFRKAKDEFEQELNRSADETIAETKPAPKPLEQSQPRVPTAHEV
jgi:sec-independent protein translocase protein TatA